MRKDRRQQHGEMPSSVKITATFSNKDGGEIIKQEGAQCSDAATLWNPACCYVGISAPQDNAMHQGFSSLCSCFTPESQVSGVNGIHDEIKHQTLLHIFSIDMLQKALW